MKKSQVSLQLTAIAAAVLLLLPTMAQAATAPDARTLSTRGGAPAIAGRDRSGEFKIAKRRRHKGLGTAIGIAAGVAAVAIIANEAAKAEKRRKKRIRTRARLRNTRNCHKSLRRHTHRALGGRTTHRHNRNCVAYKDYPESDIAVAPPRRAPRPTPRCDAGFEYIDGQCYRNEELDAQPTSDRRESAAGGDDAAYERCARAYRSFRYEDGTFQPYGDQPRRLCPYLE